MTMERQEVVAGVLSRHNADELAAELAGHRRTIDNARLAMERFIRGLQTKGARKDLQEADKEAVNIMGLSAFTQIETIARQFDGLREALKDELTASLLDTLKPATAYNLLIAIYGDPGVKLAVYKYDPWMTDTDVSQRDALFAWTRKRMSGEVSGVGEIGIAPLLAAVIIVACIAALGVAGFSYGMVVEWRKAREAHEKTLRELTAKFSAAFKEIYDIRIAAVKAKKLSPALEQAEIEKITKEYEADIKGIPGMLPPPPKSPLEDFGTVMKWVAVAAGVVVLATGIGAGLKATRK